MARILAANRRLQRANAWNVSFAPAADGGWMLTISSVMDQELVAPP